MFLCPWEITSLQVLRCPGMTISFGPFALCLMYAFSTSIESLLQSLPQQNAETAHYDSALGTALVAALGALVSGLLLYHGSR